MVDTGSGSHISTRRTKANGSKLQKLLNTSTIMFCKILKIISWSRGSEKRSQIKYDNLLKITIRQGSSGRSLKCRKVQKILRKKHKNML